MPTVEQSLEVHVPVEVAYNQWTQFESFPAFMEGVKEVRQLDDKHLHWKAEVGGKLAEWDAEITEQIPDRRIAWRSTAGEENAGVVTFHYISPDTCRIMLQMTFRPDSLVEQAGSAVGIPDRRVAGDLRRFKEFIERQGSATGGWRGTIEGHPGVADREHYQS